jgi:hypothetical protein
LGGFCDKFEGAPNDCAAYPVYVLLQCRRSVFLLVNGKPRSTATYTRAHSAANNTRNVVIVRWSAVDSGVFASQELGQFHRSYDIQDGRHRLNSGDDCANDHRATVNDGWQRIGEVLGGARIDMDEGLTVSHFALE